MPMIANISLLDLRFRILAGYQITEVSAGLRSPPKDLIGNRENSFAGFG